MRKSDVEMIVGKRIRFGMLHSIRSRLVSANRITQRTMLFVILLAARQNFVVYCERPKRYLPMVPHFRCQRNTASATSALKHRANLFRQRSAGVEC